MSLMTLPTELHLELLSILDYQSLMNLNATNRYFASLQTNDLVRKALRHFERSLNRQWATGFALATTYDHSGFNGATVTFIRELHHLPPHFVSSYLAMTASSFASETATSPCSSSQATATWMVYWRVDESAKIVWV